MLDKAPKLEGGTAFKPAAEQGPQAKWNSHNEVVLLLQNGEDKQTYEVMGSTGNKFSVRHESGGVVYEVDFFPDFILMRPQE
jgi:hypothetical protein